MYPEEAYEAAVRAMASVPADKAFPGYTSYADLLRDEIMKDALICDEGVICKIIAIDRPQNLEFQNFKEFVIAFY